jgi:uncharacterized short protein YbdD (DUF466 family)
MQIEYTKKNIIGYRNIYIVSYDSNINIPNCITINEHMYPFTIKEIGDFHGKMNRNGWYLQQLIKLYSGGVIPNILDKYLVIDCDTFFLKPTSFIENDKLLYNYSSEYHIPYIEHMSRVHPNLNKIDYNKSGICHHMIFETKYINQLIDMVEDLHKKPFWLIFLEKVTEDHRHGSGASEYEMYFNYMLKYHPDKIKLRTLNYIDTKTLDLNSNYDYISYHHHLRN